MKFRCKIHQTSHTWLTKAQKKRPAGLGDWLPGSIIQWMGLKQPWNLPGSYCPGERQAPLCTLTIPHPSGIHPSENHFFLLQGYFFLTGIFFFDGDIFFFDGTRQKQNPRQKNNIPVKKIIPVKNEISPSKRKSPSKKEFPHPKNMSLSKTKRLTFFL